MLVPEFCGNPSEEFLVAVVLVVIPLSPPCWVAGLLPTHANGSLYDINFFCLNLLVGSPEIVLETTKRDYGTYIRVCLLFIGLKPTTRFPLRGELPDRLVYPRLQTGQGVPQTRRGKCHKGGGHLCDKLAVPQALLAETGKVRVVDEIDDLSCGEPELKVLIGRLDGYFNLSDVANLPRGALLGK